MKAPIPYTQFAASQEVPPPYHFPGVTVQGFVWEASMDRVRAYCDRFFNLGDESSRGFKYGPAPFWPYALLLMIDYPVMITSDPRPENVGSEAQYADRGIISQQEVFVAIPVVRRGTTPATLAANAALEWMLPFIVVGNPMSAVCGREMLGLEKLRAQISFGEGVYPGSFRGEVSLPGWSTLNPGAMQRMIRFLTVETGPVVPTFRGAPRESSLWTLFGGRLGAGLIEGLADTANILDTLTAGAMPTTMRTVSLKQFRDAARPDRAVYQALIGCRSKYSSIINFQFYKEGDVTIEFNPTGSFRHILEFVELPPKARPSDQQHVFQPKAAYRFNAVIDFDEMRTLHTFPIEADGEIPAVAATSDLTAPWLRPWKGFFGPRRPS